MPCEKILISACLLGKKVRHDGNAATVEDQLLSIWQTEDRLVVICPEVEGGLPVPRPPAEIQTHFSGKGVLAGTAKVVREDGGDVTEHFLKGAHHALKMAKNHNVCAAILKDGSPSCAKYEIHDGTFTGKKVPGMGATAALLKKNGIKVFSEKELTAAADYVRSLEEDPPALTSKMDIS